MNAARWTVTYGLTVDGTPYAGSVTVSNTGMSDTAARQYAAHHLLDTTDLDVAADFDVGDIEVQHQEAGR